VLEMISREHGLNILVSPNVSGRVTADLSNLTLKQSLNAILKSCDLAARNENGVIYVYTAEELKQRKSDNEDDKVSIRMYRMNYVRSTDLIKILKPFLSPDGQMTATPASQVGVRPINPISGQSASGGGGGGGGAGGGGAGGGGAGGNQVSVSGGDALATQEVVLVEDRESILRKTDQIVKQLDVQPSQVLIEAVILYVTHNHSSELGVNFGVINSSGQVLSVVGDGAAINAASGFSPASVIANGLLNTPASTGGSTGGGSSGGGTGFAADTPGFKFGNSSKNITSFITALETVGNVEVLATPKLLVINKQLAELQLGDRLGYSTLSQSIVSTTQQIQFMNVGTLLRVRPFIATDGMVRMEVHPERSTGSIVNSIPQASTAEVTTNVLVPDGATLIIGGLMDHQTVFDQSGIPGLSRIPYLGALFRVRTRTTTKKELVVMLTTHIWNPREECLPAGTVGAAMEEIARPVDETLPSP
jgi:general secretion pathway protein D